DRYARYTGACQLSRVAAEVEIPEDECAEVLISNKFARLGDWCVLDEPSGTFVDTARAMHIYCGDVLPLRRLRAGLRKRSLRHAKYAAIPVPPANVIAEALARSGEFRINTECSAWRVTDTYLGGHELSGTVQGILDCLDAIGPVATYV